MSSIVVEKVHAESVTNALSAPKPFVKWVGGKRQLLPTIKDNLPVGIGETITKYAEPFVGGGALLFNLLPNYNFSDAYISDMNVGLITAYNTIRDDVYELTDLLEAIQNEFYTYKTEETKANYYYNMRSRYNELLNSASFYEIDNKTELAALFITLNKTCFNGMYRVNAKGEFNVPLGRYHEPLICDADNLFATSEYLQSVTIHCGNYQDADSFIDDQTFVYFDPPYRPITQTSAFTAYTDGGFKEGVEYVKAA
ncbi:MAG: Dam family site-specific DNA-(adenine-N6)-methyltransferase [Bifidobacteriaceae bacterium]|jgi:DNA adenine methylase|nr:Dam family site-specific DNA-(adenine-N6)-methyltransferase [Bifidobacteriaceae bacterium]